MKHVSLGWTSNVYQIPWYDLHTLVKDNGGEVYPKFFKAWGNCMGGMSTPYHKDHWLKAWGMADDFFKKYGKGE